MWAIPRKVMVTGTEARIRAGLGMEGCRSPAVKEYGVRETGVCWVKVIAGCNWQVKMARRIVEYWK